jgi:hypothetical protein
LEEKEVSRRPSRRISTGEILLMVMSWRYRLFLRRSSKLSDSCAVSGELTEWKSGGGGMGCQCSWVWRPEHEDESLPTLFHVEQKQPDHRGDPVEVEYSTESRSESPEGKVETRLDEKATTSPPADTTRLANRSHSSGGKVARDVATLNAQSTS